MQNLLFAYYNNDFYYDIGNLISVNWPVILKKVCAHEHLSDVSFQTWLAPMRIQSITGEKIVISFPIAQTLPYINMRFNLALSQSIREFTGRNYIVYFVPEEAEH